ncbi:hypothetical protein [Paracoccus sp. (in: a-proteobacteria)]|uniref:hypothetical protein n=1 Tax=Paracoccus sp. TaxID=267 RepID=UPI00396C7B12
MIVNSLVAGLSLCLGMASVSLAQGRQNLPAMTVGGAVGRVEHGLRQGDRMTVAVTFTADDPDYDGETLYADIPKADLARRIYLKIGDRDFPVWLQDGAPQIPDALTLAPHDGQGDVVAVGTWQGTFVAPTPDMGEISLFLPNVGALGPFPILDR